MSHVSHCTDQVLERPLPMFPSFTATEGRVARDGAKKREGWWWTGRMVMEEV